MSRVGRLPIPVPDGVQVEIEGSMVKATGPNGSLSYGIPPGIRAERAGEVIQIMRVSDARQHRALHGLARTLVSNLVVGVSDGFRKSLELVGVGYRVHQQEQHVILQVGYSHSVEVKPLSGCRLEVEGTNRIHVSGADKQIVGEMAARIRRIRIPNKYSGKGIRYLGEKIRLKPGKSAGRKV